MPLFFIISGYTIGITGKFNSYKIQKFGYFFKRKIYQILVPYFIYALIFGRSDLKSIFYIFWGTGSSLKLANSNPVLWFLPCYFLSFILLYLVLSAINGRYNYQLKNERKFNASLFTALIISFIFSYTMTAIIQSIPSIKSIGYPLSMNGAFVGLGFMLVGTLLGNYKKTHTIAINKNLIALVFLFASCLLFQFNLPQSTDGTNHIDIRESIYGNYLLFIVISCIGSFAFIGLGTILGRQKYPFLSSLGRNTITIMCLHLYIYQMLLIPFVKFGFVVNPIVEVLLVGLVILILKPVSEFISANLPFLTGKTKI